MVKVRKKQKHAGGRNRTSGILQGPINEGQSEEGTVGRGAQASVEVETH